MWDDRTRDALLPGRDRRRATTGRSATTTSGGCRRPTTPTAARAARPGTSVTGPVFRAGPPGAPVSPNLAGRDAAAFGALLPGVPAHASGSGRPLPALRRAHLRARRHDAGAPADGDPVRLLSRDGVARRPGARRDRARGRDCPRRTSGRAPAQALRVLPAPRRPLGARLHHRAERCGRHAQPVRHERPGPLRPVPRDPRRPRPARPAGDAGGAARRPAQAARPRRGPGRRRSVRLRLRRGRSTTPPRTGSGWPSRRASTTSSPTATGTPTTPPGGSRTCSAQTPGACRSRSATAPTYPHCMQHQVANLVGLARRIGADPGRSGGRGAEQRGGDRRRAADAAVPRRRHRPLRPVQLGRRVPGQRAVVLDGRAGHRPDRDEPPGVRPPGGRYCW